MLSVADNELITQTGPGTPMGDLFRRFWVPALLSSELEERDGPPVRFRLLNERLVAFRDTAGNIGILEERCPHRHASLYWGRNEEGGLRCVYHGWKFTTDGACVDQPAEPEDSRFKDHLHAISYSAREAGGMIWTYMGPKDKEPAFPELEFTLLPADQVMSTKRVQDCNYLQNLEGELDTAHTNFLHRQITEGDEPMVPPGWLARKRYFVAESGSGMIAMARADFPNDISYWRMTPFVLPSFTIIPSPYEATNTLTAAVPVDDTHMVGFTVTWHHEHPLSQRDIDGITSGRGVHALVDPKTFQPVANMSNDYLIDRELQRHSSFTGIFGTRGQDLPVQEDQDGPICRRHEEHLGVTDRAIVGARRLLIRLANELQEGHEPEQAANAVAFKVRSVAIEAPNDVDPVELWNGGQPEGASAVAVPS